MTTWHAFWLGVVQGLGEFLPISSSGHLIVVPWILGWEEHGLAFDVALHVGTFFAVAYAFLGEWLTLLRGVWAGLRGGRLFATAEGRVLMQIVLASIPGAVAGLLLDRWAETTFRAPVLVAVTMAVMGVVLWVADARAKGETAPPPLLPAVSTRDALLVGLAQCLAIVPGVSRSGSTISMALLLGLARPEAARFSFLLATPITFGAALVKVPKLLRAGSDLTPLLVGIVTSAVVGFVAIRVLLRYVRTRDYRPFVYYRLAFAAVVLAIAWMRG